SNDLGSDFDLQNEKRFPIILQGYVQPDILQKGNFLTQIIPKVIPIPFRDGDLSVYAFGRHIYTTQNVPSGKQDKQVITKNRRILDVVILIKRQCQSLLRRTPHFVFEFGPVNTVV